MNYEDLYRDLPLDGPQLDQRVIAHRALYNEISPHEHLDFDRPHHQYTARSPQRQRATLNGLLDADKRVTAA